jgi:thioesterase domain-containing protein
VRRKVKVLARKLGRKVFGARSEADVDLDDVIDATKFSDHEIKLWDAHLRLLQLHTSQSYDGHVTVFRTAAHPVFSSYEDDLMWGPLVKGGVSVELVNGSHGNIFLEPHVRSLAQKLSGSLADLSPKSEVMSVSNQKL